MREDSRPSRASLASTQPRGADPDSIRTKRRKAPATSRGNYQEEPSDSWETTKKRMRDRIPRKGRKSRLTVVAKEELCSWDSMNSGGPGDAVEATAAKEES